MQAVDLLVIGGGINGAGIARDAAGRGLRVLLCEKDDLARHTSSASTKLIHGGLRYLEQYEFRLVREALREREVLLRNAAHIIWPLRFVLPYEASMRPAWLLRLGLFLYDHLGARRLLPGTSRVDLGASPHGGVLKSSFRFGFEYSDCWVDDARLVVLNALDAAERGATVLTRTACVGLQREGARWLATLQPEDGAPQKVTAQAVVNAAGPWVSDVLALSEPRGHAHQVRLV
ncbi:MAG: glycerol-3-phosphate dehydrogenase, partial [Pseudomonadota bacterium]